MTTRIERHIHQAFETFTQRLLAGSTTHQEEEDDNEKNVYDSHSSSSESGGHDGDDDSHHSEFGVHITYEDLYAAMIFFTTIYVAGVVASKLMKMPSLVGEIFAGIVLGPPLLDFVPNPEAFVLLGEIGLILLVLEAGIDIDLTTLKLIGPRGVNIAIVGSFLPIVIAMGLAFALGVDTKGAIAAGASFGPTSLGIAMNILRQGKLVNTPVGQLVVSAAVIDDMIALLVLSQLSALVGDFSIQGVVIPIISALLFLCLGGYIAVYIAPDLIHTFILSKVDEDYRAQLSMAIMFLLILGLMPATYYSEASFLMGVFVAGLTFCRDHDVHHLFVGQFKRLMQWLMRIFFAASIGFQVPIKDFGSGKVIWQGLLFTLALSGKIAVGFMVPNFTQTKRFRGLHLRDCLITGFSMAAEGEFAFVIAVFAVDAGLISKDLYASVVLAVLMSTIFPPFLLRFTVNHYNKMAEKAVREAAEFELNRVMDLEKGGGAGGDDFLAEMKNNTLFFLCIQMQCESRWGLMPKILSSMQGLGLETIDHRSWHPRGVNSTMVNEIYAKDSFKSSQGNTATHLEGRLAEVQKTLVDLLNQEEAKVKVSRWYPGVLQEIVEEEESRKAVTDKRISVQDRILIEATGNLEKKRDMQLAITKQKSVAEILNDVTAQTEPKRVGFVNDVEQQQQEKGTTKKRPRRVRQKMRSTPVMGGDLFGETKEGDDTTTTTDLLKSQRKLKIEQLIKGGANQLSSLDLGMASGEKAELTVGSEVFRIRISKSTLTRIRSGYSGGLIEDSSIRISRSDAPVEVQLQGFVRNQSLARIAEETDISESSVHSSNVGDVVVAALKEN